MNPLTYYNKILALDHQLHGSSKLALRRKPFIRFFKDVTPCTLLNSHWHSEGQYSLHLQDEVDEGASVTIYHSTPR